MKASADELINIKYQEQVWLFICLERIATLNKHTNKHLENVLKEY